MWGWRYSFPRNGWLENEHRYGYNGSYERILVTHRVPLSRGEVEALAFAQKWIGFGNSKNYRQVGGGAGVAWRVLDGLFWFFWDTNLTDPNLLVAENGEKPLNCQSLGYFTENLVVPQWSSSFFGPYLEWWRRTDRRSFTSFLKGSGAFRANESFDLGVAEAALKNRLSV